MNYESCLEWSEDRGYRLTTEEQESLSVKPSLLILGGGEPPFEDHVKAILKIEDIPESEKTFIAGKVLEFRKIMTEKSQSKLELDRSKYPVSIIQYFQRMEAKNRRACLTEIFSFLESYFAESDLLKAKISLALELRDTLDETGKRDIEIAERLQDQLGSVTVLAESLSEIVRAFDELGYPTVKKPSTTR